jgi:hypothetical protein
MHSPSRSIRHLTLALAAATVLLSTCLAQEVASMDLTKVEARVETRRPKATSEETGGYSGAEFAKYCSDPTHKTGAFDTSLSMDRTHYEVGDEPRFEVRLQNTGYVPIRIPFSPHLADLQPKDPAQKFSYYELQIALWIAADKRWSTNMGGSAILYGNDSHANTMLTLQPGEWVRVVSKGNFRFDDNLLELIRSGSPANQAYAQSTVLRAETLITPKHSATVFSEVCVAQTHEQILPIEVAIP